jgi:hypothetical protein
VPFTPDGIALYSRSSSVSHLSVKRLRFVGCCHKNSASPVLIRSEILFSNDLLIGATMHLNRAFGWVVAGAVSEMTLELDLR